MSNHACFVQALPVIAIRNAGIAFVRRFGVFIRHLEKNQVGELLQIIAVADTIIAQGGAEAPDFGDDRGGVLGRLSRYTVNISITSSLTR